MSFVIIKHFKNHKMTLRILLMSLLPLLSFAQSNSKVAMPKNTQSNDKGPVELKRNALYNLDEIKVRWKKAALENCTGVPCVVTPPAPSFTCGTSTVTDVDGNVYNTKLIGSSQCWMTTNLKVTQYDDGSVIPDFTASTSNPWATSGARTEYVLTGVTGYVGTFGYLYNWYAVNDLRKLCPAGWHVPTDAEWTIMIQTLDPMQLVNSTNVSTFTGAQSATAGTVMKSTVTNPSPGNLGWNPGSSGTNTSGFSVLPGGYRDNDGSFTSIRSIAFFLSADQYNGSNANGRFMLSNNRNVYRNSPTKSYGGSVRCLKD